MAKAIAHEGMGEAFKDMTPENALQWIQSESSGSAGVAFSEFLKLHGHRCIKEVRNTTILLGIGMKDTIKAQRLVWDEDFVLETWTY